MYNDRYLVHPLKDGENNKFAALLSVKKVTPEDAKISYSLRVQSRDHSADAEAVGDNLIEIVEYRWDYSLFHLIV